MAASLRAPRVDRWLRLGSVGSPKDSRIIPEALDANPMVVAGSSSSSDGEDSVVLVVVLL